MSDERRYDEHEVAAIFERATRVQREPERPGDDGEGSRAIEGLTLTEIKRIGAEVGISAELIERSARGLAHRHDPVDVNRRVAGIPVGVSGSVHLPRPLTDEEWSRLVLLIRDRFSAQGSLEELGSLRSWRNGNLRIQMGPAAEGGQWLQMGTVRQNSMQLMAAGAGMLALAIVLTVVAVFGGATSSLGEILPGVLGLGGMGGAFLGSQLLQLPRWARARRGQMEEIAAEALAMTSRTLPTGDPDRDPG